MPNSSSAVDHAVHGVHAVVGAEHDAEQAAGTGEVALPQLVAAARPAGRGDSTSRTSGRLAQPFGDADAGLPSAHAGARRCVRSAAQREPAIVRARRTGRAARETACRRCQSSSVFVVTLPSRDVGMSADVFRQRLDRHVDAVLERLEEVDAPGVVHHHLGTASHARPGRWRGCPAPRTCGCRGFRCRRPSCSAASAPRCRPRRSRDRSRSSPRRSGCSIAVAERPRGAIARCPASARDRLT